MQEHAQPITPVLSDLPHVERLADRVARAGAGVQRAVRVLEDDLEVAARRASPSRSLSMVSPSRMRPAVISTSRITASSVVDLPEPLSPTRPKVVPGGTSKEIPSTAHTLECGPHGTRRGSLKWTRRSLTWSTLSLMGRDRPREPCDDAADLSAGPRGPELRWPRCTVA